MEVNKDLGNHSTWFRYYKDNVGSDVIDKEHDIYENCHI